MSRRGGILLELLVAGVLLGTLLVLGAQLLKVAADGRRESDRRQAALDELANVLERVAARPWTELTESALAQEKLSPETEKQLPGAELKIAVAEQPQQPIAKRLTVSIRWRDRGGEFIKPLSITTWKYKTED
jgi:hypothetical protein